MDGSLCYSRVQASQYDITTILHTSHQSVRSVPAIKGFGGCGHAIAKLKQLGIRTPSTKQVINDCKMKPKCGFYKGFIKVDSWILGALSLLYVGFSV